jgi:alkanesulfonate monooxygenase SsuD/methylene tetrahydromethanopterin reductase-like flavin-dependent oxidoreductase (luciferase family)
MNVSVSADSDAARGHARRQAALIVGNPGMWPAMDALGFDMASAQATKQAFDDGLGIDGASQQVSARIVDDLIISGTPDEVVEPLASLRDTARANGYGHFILGGPLGPDPAEAAAVLTDVVIPAVWTDR